MRTLKTPRSRSLLQGALLAGLTAVATGAVAGSAPWRTSDTPLEIATAALAEWWEAGHDGTTLDRDELVLRHDAALAAASNVPAAERAAVWQAAAPMRGLLEAGTFASPADRARMLTRIPEWLELAPDAAARVAVLRAGVVLAEPLSRSSDRATREQWSATSMRWLDGMRTSGEPGSALFATRHEQRLARLAPGSVSPTFHARDLAGNVVRGRDFAGSVTVVRFWSTDRPASIEAHRRDKSLERRFWDAPFQLVGMSASQDREHHLEFVQEHTLGGVQVFDGPISVQLADQLAKDVGVFARAGDQAEIGAALPAFGSPPAGTLLVIDTRGVIRAWNPDPMKVEAIVKGLVDEHREAVRARQGAQANGEDRGTVRARSRARAQRKSNNEGGGGRGRR